MIFVLVSKKENWNIEMLVKTDKQAKAQRNPKAAEEEGTWQACVSPGVQTQHRPMTQSINQYL